MKIRWLTIILFVVVGVWFYAPLSAGAETSQEKIAQIRAEIERREQEIERLRREQEKLGQNLAGTRAEAQTLQSKINNLNGQIKYMEKQIYLTTVSIDKTNMEIGATRNSIQDTEVKIGVQKNAVARTLLFLDRQDGENTLMLFLKNDNMSDFLRQQQYANSLNSELLDLILELRNTKEDFESQKKRYESKKTELERLKQEQGYEKIALSTVKSETNGLLKTTKGQEAEYQKLLTEAEELERQANLEIFKLEDELRRTIDPNSLPLARSGILGWPVQVKGTISQLYGCIKTSHARRYYPSCDNGKGGFHNGLDIAASYGTSLLAAEDGKVIATGNAPSAYGLWLVVEHPNELVTAYTHMSVKLVDVGQEVKRGDPVGRMGNTGLSTGNHTHFMVYAPKTFTVQSSKISGTLPIGATLDPQDYL